MGYFALAQQNVLHDSAFMQTFCLLKGLLCIGGHVYCSIPQKMKLVIAGGEIFEDCFHTGWAQAVEFVKQWLLWDPVYFSLDT